MKTRPAQIKELTQTRTVVTPEGEVLAEESTTITENRFSSSEPSYIKIYIDAWLTFKGLKGISKTGLDVLYHLLPEMRYADECQRLVVNMHIKKEIAHALGTSVGVVANQITALQKAGVLTRIDRGTYIVNPELVGRGEWKDIQHIRSIYGTFTISADGCTVQPEIDVDEPE